MKPISYQATRLSPVSDHPHGSKDHTSRMSQVPAKVLCDVCRAVLGVEDSSLCGLKIYKAGVAVQRGRRNEKGVDGERDTWETYPPDMFACAQLLDLVERTGTRRFVIHTDADGAEVRSRNGLLVGFIASDASFGMR